MQSSRELRDLVAELDALVGVLHASLPGIERSRILRIMIATYPDIDRCVQALLAAQRCQVAREGRGSRGSVIGPTTLH